jgi:hypothetical protein
MVVDRDESLVPLLVVVELALKVGVEEVEVELVLLLTSLLVAGSCQSTPDTGVALARSALTVV